MATVTVRGRATVPVTPDEVTLGLTVEALEGTAAAAFAEASRRAGELAALCDALGVPPAARSTARVSLAEHGEHDRDGRWHHRGFSATSRVAVTLGEAELAIRLLSEAVARAAVRVDGPVWGVADDNPAHEEARRRAAADARRRASDYVEALGARLGAIESIAEPGTGPPPGPRPLRAAALAEADMPLEAGEQEVAAAVDVTFVVEQG
jgi:hypothetical protein